MGTKFSVECPKSMHPYYIYLFTNIYFIIYDYFSVIAAFYNITINIYTRNRILHNVAYVKYHNMKQNILKRHLETLEKHTN
jgi:hypothetical protein